MSLNEAVGIENGKIGRYQSTKEGDVFFEPLCNAVYVIGIQQYEEEENYELKLGYEYNGIEHTLLLPRKNLSRRALLELSGKGIDAFEHTVGTLIKVIQLQEEQYLKNGGGIEYLHKKLGWDKVQVDGEMIDVFKHYTVDDVYESRYVGNYDIKPKGTLQGWIQNIKDDVIGYAPSEFILSCALSSVVLGFIGQEANCENILIHLAGDSSCGKTTMGFLATATAGNPDMSSNSLCRTWGATSNSILASKIGNFGLVTVLDELSMYTGINMTDLIYKMSAGVDKGRLTKECELSETKGFLTVHLSTGEACISSRCNKNTGIQLRLGEFKTAFTRSAKNSEKIKQNSLRNYGFAAPELAKTVKEKGRKNLLERLEHWKSAYKEETKIPEFSDRMSIRYGIIMLAGELIRETFDLDLNLNNILYFLINNEYENSNNRDIALEAYHKVIGYIHMNHHHFAKTINTPIKKTIEDYSNTQSLWGKIDSITNKERKVNDKPVVEEISIFRDKFTEIIHEVGFEDEKIILEKMKLKGLLNCEDGRYYRKRKIIESGPVERVYVINVLGEEEDKEETSNINVKTQTNKKIIKRQ